MKWKFFIMMIAFQLMQINSYAQNKDNGISKKDKLSQRDDIEEMSKYLNLSADQIDKIKTIRKDNQSMVKNGSNVPVSPDALLMTKITNQERIDNLLSSQQKLKMRRFEMKENYKKGLEEKINLSQIQENKIDIICEESCDKQQAILNSSSSPEDVKQQIGKLNTETSDKVLSVLTIEQKKELTENIKQ